MGGCLYFIFIKLICRLFVKWKYLIKPTQEQWRGIFKELNNYLKSPPTKYWASYLQTLKPCCAEYILYKYHNKKVFTFPSSNTTESHGDAYLVGHIACEHLTIRALRRLQFQVILRVVRGIYIFVVTAAVIVVIVERDLLRVVVIFFGVVVGWLLWRQRQRWRWRIVMYWRPSNRWITKMRRHWKHRLPRWYRERIRWRRWLCRWRLRMIHGHDLRH